MCGGESWLAHPARWSQLWGKLSLSSSPRQWLLLAGFPVPSAMHPFPFALPGCYGNKGVIDVGCAREHVGTQLILPAVSPVPGLEKSSAQGATDYESCPVLPPQSSLCALLLLHKFFYSPLDQSGSYFCAILCPTRTVGRSLSGVAWRVIPCAPCQDCP